MNLVDAVVLEVLGEIQKFEYDDCKPLYEVRVKVNSWGREYETSWHGFSKEEAENVKVGFKFLT